MIVCSDSSLMCVCHITVKSVKHIFTLPHNGNPIQSTEGRHVYCTVTSQELISPADHSLLKSNIEKPKKGDCSYLNPDDPCQLSCVSHQRLKLASPGSDIAEMKIGHRQQLSSVVHCGSFWNSSRGKVVEMQRAILKTYT